MNLPPVRPKAGEKARRPSKPYLNVTPWIGAVISSGLATMGDLSTVLSTEDAFLLYEIAAIDGYNGRPD